MTIFPTDSNINLFKNSKGCFRIVRLSAFQNTPYFLSEIHLKELKISKSMWDKLVGTPCITKLSQNLQSYLKFNERRVNKMWT